MSASAIAIAISPHYAKYFAHAAHAGQVRKYTGEPYINHPRAVAIIANAHDLGDNAMSVAWLHDTVEDTPVTQDMIWDMFGNEVAAGVALLTDETWPDGERPNRRTRKAIAVERIAAAPAWVQGVKVCDLIDNTRSIVEHDPKFAALYLVEKIELLKVMSDDVPKSLMARAWTQVEASYERLEGK